jgi:hypothetical protein
MSAINHRRKPFPQILNQCIHILQPNVQPQQRIQGFVRSVITITHVCDDDQAFEPAPRSAKAEQLQGVDEVFQMGGQRRRVRACSDPASSAPHHSCS